MTDVAIRKTHLAHFGLSHFQHGIVGQLVRGKESNPILISLGRLNARLADRRITVEVTPAAKDWLALTGFDPVYGARPLRRLIQTTIEDQLAQQVLGGQVSDGDTITFDVDWEHPTTATNFGVAFDLAAVAQGDNEGGDQAFGTVQTVTDTGGTANQNYKTAESSAITAAGSPAAGDFLNLRFRRMTGNAADNMSVVARVKSVNIYFITDAGHD